MQYHIQRTTLSHVRLIAAAMVLLLPILINGCGTAPEIDPLSAVKKSLADENTYSIILEDMREEGTFVKKYSHKYLIVIPENSWQTEWITVPENYYNSCLNLMGMALLSRKNGVFDNLAAPPGYGFVDNPEYGRWRESDNSGSFWEFYGKYAFISNLFGGWYHPIYRTDFKTYKKYKNTRKVYFGSKNQYGSSGHIVKQKKPGFYASRMASASSKKSSFANTVNSKIGRSKTGLRSRSGGKGK